MGVIGLMLSVNDTQIDLYNQLPQWAKYEILKSVNEKFRVELTNVSFVVDKLRKERKYLI